MQVLNGVELDRALLDAFIERGEQAHEIARAHHNDPGSNGFTFGTDRFQRACELVRGDLEDAGFRVYSKGAGLRAERDGLTLHFATARTADVDAPSSFDRHTDSRLEAATFNALSPLPGLGFDELPAVSAVHVVWSGNSAAGLLAVHVGRLTLESGGVVSWAEVRRIDTLTGSDGETESASDSPAPSYLDQPEPSLELGLRDQGEGEGETGAAGS